MNRPVTAINLNQRMADLEQEVKVCRRSIRRTRWGIGGLIAMMTFVLVGATGQTERVVDELRAKRVTVVDDKGNIRAMLSVTDGGSQLLMSDNKNHTRVKLYTDAEGSATMALCDEKNQPRVLLFVSDDGTPQLALSDEKGKGRARLHLAADGSPNMSVDDSKGKGRAMLYLAADGSPTLSMHDERGAARAVLGVAETVAPDGTRTTSPESALTTFGPDGKVKWKTP